MKAANLYFLDLENSNLQGALLQYANMEGICLSHARLDGADLQHTDLRVYTHAVNYVALFCDQHDTSPTPANLSDAVLTKADLTGAYLSQANLTGADLTQAHLTDADLSGANLSGTNLDKTVLKGARYNSKEILAKDSQGKYLIDVLPTTWPQGFNPKAARATENNTYFAVRSSLQKGLSQRTVRVEPLFAEGKDWHCRLNRSWAERKNYSYHQILMICPVFLSRKLDGRS